MSTKQPQQQATTNSRGSVMTAACHHHHDTSAKAVRAGGMGQKGCDGVGASATTAIARRTAAATPHFER